MDVNDIVFYDPKRNVPTSRSAVRKAVKLRKRQSYEMRAFFAAVRGDNFEEVLNGVGHVRQAGVISRMA